MSDCNVRSVGAVHCCLGSRDVTSAAVCVSLSVPGNVWRRLWALWGQESESRQPGLWATQTAEGQSRVRPRREPRAQDHSPLPWHRGALGRAALLDLLRHINMLGLFSAESSNQDKTETTLRVIYLLEINSIHYHVDCQLWMHSHLLITLNSPSRTATHMDNTSRWRGPPVAHQERGDSFQTRPVLQELRSRVRTIRREHSQRDFPPELRHHVLPPWLPGSCLAPWCGYYPLHYITLHYSTVM